MSILYLGLDVHKDSLTIAVFGPHGSEPRLVEKLPYDLPKLRRFLQRLTRNGEQIRACYEASAAGYVLQRQLQAWGYHCDLCAPSLTPTRPGNRRKHDRRDATQLGKWYRDGDLVLIRIPSEAEERVRDLVRCRGTFQKEILQSRHYLLKFLRRRGFVFREGTNWSRSHFIWMRRLLSENQLTQEDAVVFSEYLALLEYKLSRRGELDRRIEELALRPLYKPVVDRLKCFRGIETHAAEESLCGRLRPNPRALETAPDESDSLTLYTPRACNRRISAGFTVEAASPAPLGLVLLDRCPSISTTLAFRGGGLPLGDSGMRKSMPGPPSSATACQAPVPSGGEKRAAASSSSTGPITTGPPIAVSITTRPDTVGAWSTD
jgi:transposase